MRAGVGVLVGFHMHNLMVIDDDVGTQQLLAAICLRHDIQFFAVSSGGEAQRLAAMEPPAAIVVDFYMPHMDGLAVVEAFKNDAALHYVPIIGISAGSLQSERLKRFIAVCDVFLRKPFHATELLNALDNLVCGSH